jgi:cell division protein FtsZ
MAENDESDAPAVIRRRDRKAQVDALKSTGLDDLDIPAFLRRQVD